jgi:hypothetical protein
MTVFSNFTLASRGMEHFSASAEQYNLLQDCLSSLGRLDEISMSATMAAPNLKGIRFWQGHQGLKLNSDLRHGETHGKSVLQR